jgi:hypothetical protein
MKLSLKAYESSTTNVRLFVYSAITSEFSYDCSRSNACRCAHYFALPMPNQVPRLFSRLAALLGCSPPHVEFTPVVEVPKVATLFDSAPSSSRHVFHKYLHFHNSIFHFLQQHLFWRCSRFFRTTAVLHVVS